MAVGSKKACFIRTDGSVWCWGYEGFGIGVTGWNDSDNSQPYPEKVEGLPGPATDLSLSFGSMCALLEDTSVWCWGHSVASLIGISEGSNYEYIHYPEPVRYGPYGEIVTGVVDVIHSTNQHATLLMENGDILSWGQGGWVAANQFVPSPTWLPWQGLPIQDALGIAISASENGRYIFRANGEVIVSAPKSGNVYTKQSSGLYEELCD